MKCRPSSALLLLLAACEHAPAGDRTPAPDPLPKRTSSRAPDFGQARAKLLPLLTRSMERPKRFAERPCPDAEIARHGEAARELSLRVSDARYDTRHVIPLRVTRHVVTPDLNRLDQLLAGVEVGGDRENAAASVERLAAQRYVGVHHVVHYVSPKWVVRVGKRKPSWEAGRIDSWFSVHDAQSGTSLCATRVTVVGDATAAPIRVRLRSDTRDKLTDALGERLREATAVAVARISQSLTVPGGAETLARR